MRMQELVGSGRRWFGAASLFFILFGVVGWASAGALTTGTLSDPHEPNNDLASATPIVFGVPISASIDPAGDVDYYRLDGVAGQMLLLEYGTDNNYSTVSILSQDGAVLVEKHYTVYGPFEVNQLYVRLPAAGAYYVLVESNSVEEAPSYTLTVDEGHPPILVSARISGVAGGVAFTPGDILRHRIGTDEWEMFFDASDVGITRNVTAFSVSNYGGEWELILLALNANQVVPGLGVVRPQDIFYFDPETLGPQTSGYFGRTRLDRTYVGLLDSGEAIDAIGNGWWGGGGYEFTLSTTGSFRVGSWDDWGTIKRCAGRDEDVLYLGLDDEGGIRSWCGIIFDGSDVTGLAAEDVTGLDVPEWDYYAPDVRYISVANAFNIGGVRGEADDILLVQGDEYGAYTVTKIWDGRADGFPYALDGIDIPYTIYAPQLP